MKHLKYRPDVDGLRAVAVALVLMFHTGLGFSGGYIGVDVFFVISGFLITGLILKSQYAGDFSLAQFWVRRIRRIIPAALTMAVVVLLLGVFLLLPSDLESLAESTVAQQTMLSNVYFWKNTGYFDGPAETKPLLHTWSLAVEEQFYLAYPLLLMLLHRFGRKTTFSALAGLALLSLVACEYAVRRSPSATFYLLPTRAWELVLGGLICFVPPSTRLPRWCLELVSWLAVGSIILCGWLYDASTLFPGLSAAIPCAAAALLIYANTHTLSVPASVLATKPFVFIGLISYSLYLWHWPILAYLRYWTGNSLSTGVAFFAVSLSVALAILSWHLVEKPFRRRRTDDQFRSVFGRAATASGTCIALAVLVVVLEGIPARMPSSVTARLEQVNGPRVEQRSADGIKVNGLPILNSGTEGDAGNPDVVVWGDSHAEMLADLLRDVGNEYDLKIAMAVQHATVPLLSISAGGSANHQEEWNSAVLDYIIHKKVRFVLLVSRWENTRGWLRKDEHRTLSLAQRRQKSEARATLEHGLQSTLEVLDQHGVQVWIMKQVPTQVGLNPNRRLVLAALFGNKPPSGISRIANSQRMSFVEQAFSTSISDDVNVIDPDFTCFQENGFSKLSDASLNSYYRDADHLSPLGVEILLGGLFRPVFEQISAEVHATEQSVHAQPADR